MNRFATLHWQESKREMDPQKRVTHGEKDKNRKGGTHGRKRYMEVKGPMKGGRHTKGEDTPRPHQAVLIHINQASLGRALISSFTRPLYLLQSGLIEQSL